MRRCERPACSHPTAAEFQQQEAKVRRDTEDAKKVFQDLSARAQQDEEEAARVQKERDELL